MFYLLLLLVLDARLLAGQVTDASYDKTESEMMTLIDKLLDPKNGYDKRVRPTVSADEPTLVEIGLFVNSLSSVSDVSMDFIIDMYLRQRWIDPRLKFTKFDQELTLMHNHIEIMWTSDIFFRNAKKGHSHSLTKPNQAAWLFPNGTVYFSQRVTVTASCPMYLANFPFDSHLCKLRIESYAYALNQIQLQWMVNKPPVEFDKDSLNIELPEFEILSIKTFNCDASYSSGNFSCLYASVSFKRDTGFYLSGAYIPSMLIVILSWVSFFMDPNATPSRTTLGILTVLTITTQASAMRSMLPRVSYIKGRFSCATMELRLQRDSGYYMISVYMPSCLVVIISWVSFFLCPSSAPARTSLGILCVLTIATQASTGQRMLPKVSYLKAIDWWMSICLAFVFGALIEFALANYVHRKELEARSQQSDLAKAKQENEAYRSRVDRLTRTNLALLKRSLHDAPLATDEISELEAMLGSQADDLLVRDRTFDSLLNPSMAASTMVLDKVQSTTMIEENENTMEMTSMANMGVMALGSCGGARGGANGGVARAGSGGESGTPVPKAARAPASPGGLLADCLLCNCHNRVACVRADDAAGAHRRASQDTNGVKIDKACRVIFPVLFVLFNIGYWSKYATTDPSQDLQR